MILSLKSVNKSIDDRLILSNISFDLNEGETICLIGPSGCGKTTCLKTINKLLDFDSGEIHFRNKNTNEINSIELRRQIGYVLQSPALFPHMTVSKNISLLPELLGWEKEETINQVDKLLSLVNLDNAAYKNRYPHELSGGQQQRVSIARAMSVNASLLLMDEPFSALDPITKNQIQNEFIKLKKKVNKSVVLVSHDIEEAFKLADKIAIMDKGEIIQLGSVNEIQSNPKNDFVKSFIRRNVSL